MRLEDDDGDGNVLGNARGFGEGGEMEMPKMPAQYARGVEVEMEMEARGRRLVGAGAAVGVGVEKQRREREPVGEGEGADWYRRADGLSSADMSSDMEKGAVMGYGRDWDSGSAM